MRRALFALILAVAPVAFGDDVAKGLQNLENLFTIAYRFDVARELGVTPEFGQPLDPWGTPYRIEFDAGRAVGAGSDRTFDEATWTVSEQFTSFEGDVVFAGGQFVRTNHNWLCARITSEAGPALAALRKAETMLLLGRTPWMRKAVGSKATSLTLEQMGRLVNGFREKHGSLAKLAPPADAVRVLMAEHGLGDHVPFDAWRTPLRFSVTGESYHIVSAGADRTFQPMTWQTAPKPDPAEDIVFADGSFTRRVTDEQFIDAFGFTAEPIPQPPDRAMRLDPNVPFKPIDKTIAPPVVIQRVEPVYPEPYRMTRVTGIVIVEVAISETGETHNFAVLKSLGPAIDMAALDAVKKWKFKPATRDGKAIPVLFNLTINFKLK